MRRYMRSAINLGLFTGWENVVVSNIVTLDAKKNSLFVSVCVVDYN